MKKISRKLFLSIFTLLLTIATLGSVTFAWMSLNAEAWVEGMDFQATGGDGFFISVDDKNYKSHLTKDDIVKSIVKNYSNDMYRFDDSGNLVDLNKQVISNYDAIMKKNILLYPCTSYGSANQFLLTKLTGEAVDPSDGQYIQFDIFFRLVSDTKRNLDIYMNGEEGRVMPQMGEEHQIPQTKITTSKLDEINLQSSLTTYNLLNGEKISMVSGDKLTVRSSNALRLGFNSQQNEHTTILELSDEYDLGSYATNISDYTNKDHELYDDTLMYDVKYDATKNAMFTYFNGLKNNSLKAIDYKKIPLTETSLLDNKGKNRVKVCTLESSEESVEVHFKLWLEGWDADSIEGIAEQISVQLSFAQ